MLANIAINSLFFSYPGFTLNSITFIAFNSLELLIMALIPKDSKKIPTYHDQLAICYILAIAFIVCTARYSLVTPYFLEFLLIQMVFYDFIPLITEHKLNPSLAQMRIALQRTALFAAFLYIAPTPLRLYNYQNIAGIVCLMKCCEYSSEFIEENNVFPRILSSIPFCGGSSISKKHTI